MKKNFLRLALLFLFFENLCAQDVQSFANISHLTDAQKIAITSYCRKFSELSSTQKAIIALFCKGKITYEQMWQELALIQNEGASVHIVNQVHNDGRAGVQVTSVQAEEHTREKDPGFLMKLGQATLEILPALPYIQMGVQALVEATTKVKL
jgi:hypothetical protein